MFLRRIFSTDNKFFWVLVDLLIVIIGVYCAFLIQNYAEDQRNAKERDRVLTSLKYEMEFFRFRMSETALGMKGMVEEMQQISKEGEVGDFSNFRFIEPQYDYQTIDYALKLQNTDIVDFQLYDELQSLFVEIKKIEHVERLLTETSRRYKTVPDGIDDNKPRVKLLRAENQDNFDRFIVLLNDRAEISSRIAKASEDALPLINNRLGIEKARQIEEEIIRENVSLARSEKEAVIIVRQYFPDFPEEKVREYYNN